MSCFKPLSAWQSLGKKDNGKSFITFSLPNNPQKYEFVKLPCGRCLGCRLKKSREWAVRCFHEALQYDNNCFLTLTYDDEHLPIDESLDKRHFQLFMKSLRRRNPDKKIRYLHCGEYGEKNGRPHYHALIFNYDFPDRVRISTKSRYPAYISPEVEKIWDKGFHFIGKLTFDSAAYTCRYAVKKLSEGNTQESKDKYYEKYMYKLPDGTIGLKEPEYITMSRRKGIGYNHLEKNWNDFKRGHVIIQGKEYPLPRYYDNYLETTCKQDFESIKEGRKKFIEENSELFSPEALKDKEKRVRKRYREYKLSRSHV